MEPIISKTGNVFSFSCGVSVNIRAGAGDIWRLLSDAQNYPRWNSTVTRIEGRIAEGESLKLQVPGTSRVFTLKITGLTPERGMTWSSGVQPLFKGVRVFTLTPQEGASTNFAMTERFSGLMVPLVKGAMPDFGPIFARFAADLKTAAEA